MCVCVCVCVCVCACHKVNEFGCDVIHHYQDNVQQGILRGLKI